VLILNTVIKEDLNVKAVCKEPLCAVEGRRTEEFKAE
jgi:hypothetical protein